MQPREIMRWLAECNAMPNTHRRRRRDSTVELRRVGAVNTPVGSRDPIYDFPWRWAIEVGDKWRQWRHCWKNINIDQNSRSQTAIQFFGGPRPPLGVRYQGLVNL